MGPQVTVTGSPGGGGGGWRRLQSQLWPCGLRRASGASLSLCFSFSKMGQQHLPERVRARCGNSCEVGLPGEPGVAACHPPHDYSGSHRNPVQGLRPPSPNSRVRHVCGRAALESAPDGSHHSGMAGALGLMSCPAGVQGWPGQDAPCSDRRDQAQFLLGRPGLA